MVIMNIGLAVGGDTGRRVIGGTYTKALDFMQSAGWEVLIAEVKEFDDGFREPTLVAVVVFYTPDWKEDVFELALETQQDCVACWYREREGEPAVGVLIGPDSRTWEPFDKSLFIQPEQRL